MQIILVRHGLPDRIEPTTTPADPDLTDVGRRQAQSLIAAAEHLDVSSIVSSPMARAVQTCEPLSQHLGGADSLQLQASLQPQDRG